jgi:DNA-binding transcriptional ArsR family regulator
MPKEANKQIEQKILSLWTKATKDELVSYKELIKILKSDGVSERTVARHLLTLMKENKLEKIEQGYKKTFYKPTEEFWKNASYLKKQSQIHEESLKRIGTYIMNRLNAAIENAEETTKYAETTVWEKISEFLPNDESADDTEAFEKGMEAFLNEKKLTEGQRKELYSLVDSLIKDGICQALTDPTVFARLQPKEELPYILEEYIWKIVRAFMAVWIFLYEHPYAVPELESHLLK